MPGLEKPAASSARPRELQNHGRGDIWPD